MLNILFLEKRAKDTKGEHRFDISIKDNNNKMLLIIECKTQGQEYNNALNSLKNRDDNQLFKYLNQDKTIEYLVLYTSDFANNRVKEKYTLIVVKGNEKLLQENPKLKSYTMRVIIRTLQCMERNLQARSF